MKPKVILCGDGGENFEQIRPFFENSILDDKFGVEKISDISVLPDLPQNEGSVLFLNPSGFPAEELIPLIQNLVRKNPCLKVIIFAVDLEMADVKKLFEKGIKAYVGKNASSAELKEAFTEVLSSKIYMTDEAKNRLVHFVCEVEDAEIRIHKLSTEITRREKEILKLVCEGFRTKKIADQLGISPHTVECHRRNIMHKFNIRNSANLIKFARENHLTER